LGTKIYGLISSNAGLGGWQDVCVKGYDNYYGLESITTPLSYQKIWNGEEVVVGGLNEAIGTDWEDISTFDADNSYLGGNAVSGLTLSSNAVGDCYNTYAGKVSGGARVVRVYYLDANWDAQTLDVNMSGQVPVKLGTDILIPNRIEVVDVGASGEAAGDVVLSMSGTQYLKIEQACNESYNGFYYVPNNKNLIVTDAFCYPRSDNDESLEFVYKIQEPRTVGGSTNYLEYYKWAGSFITGASTAMAPNMNSPVLVKEKCRIRMRAKSQAGTGKAIGYFKGYLVDEKS
jgi:hypothetical protein